MAEIRSEMVASVYEVAVRPGDELDDGDTLFVLQAMKMEVPVRAEDHYRVVSVEVGEGDTVQEGDLLAVVE
ncbi:biotin/lipoyl-binding carrier protein [Streptomonospora sp. PA3]|uniref:biotin/lipoyl-binding carrier protein n=1 Tax=Streptomonospora sp. PA3 TaxID=2607326 RepID=UPI0012DCC2C2|nr:biotin/lipoyl-binding carrier protein [Streptomonospora sp. PA3]MUL39887.1 biotin/lipoyl-binding carrier protein [Streptomonospora sp. PA3]